MLLSKAAMSWQQLLSTQIVRAASISETAFDGVILVAHGAKPALATQQLNGVGAFVSDYLNVHRGALNLGSANLVAVEKSIVPSGRLIIAGTGPVTRDFDDVRRFHSAAKYGVQLALSAGLHSPLLVTLPHERYPNAELVAALGALHLAYSPLNVREEENRKKFARFGILPLGSNASNLVSLVEAFDASFTVSRDVGDSGPERMAPPKAAAYVQHAFENSNVKVSVVSDQAEIEREYPLMAAVNRAANEIPRHHARLIRLEYNGEGEVAETLFLVGKGVTIDTGGVDLKIGGHMWGMSRDKYGSAVVAGFFKMLDILKPKNIKCVGYMCMVRNSIGSNAYTCDEVIKARSGKRIHIYNTDAEGRITMLDPLTKAKEEALTAKNPHLITLATLTGHEILSYGYYAAIMDNGPASAKKWAQKIQESGDAYGQPVEISRLHAEDYDFHRAECEQADLRQGNTKPSVQTLRGHMTPAAFLQLASRLNEHGSDSAQPIAFSHIDMGSCQGDHPETSYPNPLVALTAALVLPRL